MHKFHMKCKSFRAGVGLAFFLYLLMYFEGMYQKRIIVNLSKQTYLVCELSISVTLCHMTTCQSCPQVSITKYTHSMCHVGILVMMIPQMGIFVTLPQVQENKLSPLPSKHLCPPLPSA